MNFSDFFIWDENFLSPEKPVPLAIRSQQDNFLSFQREVNRALNGFYNNFVAPGTQAPWGVIPANNPSEPLVDVIENTVEFRVSVEVPGITPDDVSITSEGQYITIAGNKNENERDKEDSYLSHERAYGKFSRTKLLPASANLNDAQATFKSGVITINIPKRSGQETEKEEVVKHISIKKEDDATTKLKVKPSK